MRGPLLLLGALFHFALVATPASGTDLFCHSRFSSFIDFEYPQSLAKLYPGVPHTIQDLDKFLRDKLGAEVLDSIKQKSTRYYLVAGPGKNALEYLRKDSIQSFREIENSFGAFNTLEVKLKDGSTSYFFTNVNGANRETQVLSLLKLAGAPRERVQVLGRSLPYHSVYRRTFQKIGHRPDFVVFGFANTVAEGLIESAASPVSKSMSQKNRNYAQNKWIKPRFDEHELKKMGVQVLEFQSGKKVWLIDNEYGDRAAWLMDALNELGSKNTVFLGTAGSLSPQFKVGDLLSPNKLVGMSSESGVRKIKSKIPQRGAHGDVDSPSLETKEWLKQQLSAGVDYIDVELQKVLPKVSKDSNFSAYFVVSDEINSPKVKDYTHWGEADRQSIKGRITDLVRKHLEDVGISVSDQPIDLRVHLFETPREAP